MIKKSWVSLLLICVLTHAEAWHAGACSATSPPSRMQGCRRDDKHRALSFKALKGLFIQEDASTALPSPGQHVAFGARKPWPAILQKLSPGRKLLFFVRHGEAVSNAVQAQVGELAWASVATACSWHNRSSGETLRLYDPLLTERGVDQVKRLHASLKGGATTLKDLTGNRPFKTIFSPLTRTVQTFLIAFEGLTNFSEASTDEYCRERFGHNTCDARSQASLLPSSKNSIRDNLELIPCPFLDPLDQSFPGLQFHIARNEHELGLTGNHDPWWAADSREDDASIERRAERFLERVFLNVSEEIVVVVTHSGMIGALLTAMGRDAYSATNAEVVPALVEAEMLGTFEEL